MRKRDYMILAAGAAVALALVGSGGSACFFKSVYGVPCPGCGMTRALLALACGDVALAFSFHPLVPLVPFIGLVAFFRKTAPFRAMYDGGVFWVACAVCFVGVWAVRMAAYFPDTPPMEYSRSSLAYRAFELLFN